MPVRVVVREEPVVADDALPGLLELLDDGERARAGGKRRPAPFVTAHAVARRLIGDLAGVDPHSLSFVRRCTTCGSDAHGKPSIVGEQQWRYSLSYTAGLVVVAATEQREIGVDVEALVEAEFADYDRVTLAPSERAAFVGLVGPGRLDARARVWARKEAILKATGYGLRVDPTEVLVTGPADPPAMVEWRADGNPPGSVAIAEIPLRSAEHRAAVAVLGEAEIEVERA